jgi:hypothetical protein
VTADRQIAAVLMATGAKGVKLPDLEEQRRSFDRMLVEAPRQLDPRQTLLLDALGVRDGRGRDDRRH